MKKTFVAVTITAVVAVLAIGIVRTSSAADGKTSACVACHTGPTAFSALIANWVKGADAKLVAKAQAASPAGVTLKGKHMNVASMVKSVPDGCVKCHNDKSKNAPAMNKLMHMIHLTGADNKFAATGTCASCHSLNDKTGEQTVSCGASN